MNAKKIAIAAFGSLLLIGGVAHAASEGFGPGGKRDRGPMGGMRGDAAFVRMLKLADADKDGKVTKAEADAGFLKVFEAIDADKDGAATPGEFRAYAKARMEEFRKNNPKPEEAAAAAPEQAAKDGNADEGRRGPHGDGPRWGKHHDDERGEGHRFGKRKDGEGRPMKASFILRQADTDENGQVSRDEAVKFGEGIFNRMDTNKDGVISIDDLPNRPFP